jgi:16S rRNA (uracil1498-N3)-methyltransferase
MSRKRFFVSRERISGGVAFPHPDQVHHLRDVLRISAGEEVEVFDGEGGIYLGKVEVRGSETSIVRLTKLASQEESHPRVVLASALIKADRFEWMLEKATELGADEIIPLETRFCEIHISPAKLEQRLERWRRIVREAARQCRRVSVPRIHEPMGFPALVCSGHTPSIRVLLSEKAAEAWNCSTSPSDEVLICTGPEGGWDPSEVETAANAGFGIFRIGSRIMRSETAPLAALAIIGYVAELGEIPK